MFDQIKYQLQREKTIHVYEFLCRLYPDKPYTMTGAIHPGMYELWDNGVIELEVQRRDYWGNALFTVVKLNPMQGPQPE